jgi:hypothetical protein
MLESTLAKTKPGKAFTVAVIASVTGLVVKGSSATEAIAAVNKSSAAITRVPSLMSATTAKMITAAMVAIGVGIVLTYTATTKAPNEPALTKPVDTISIQETATNVEEPIATETMNVRPASLEEAAVGQEAGVIASKLSAMASTQYKTDDNTSEDIGWQPDPPGTSGSVSNHLVFVRTDIINEGNRGNTVLLASSDGETFTVKAVDSMSKWSTVADIFAVGRGKLYCILGHERKLAEIDLASGERRIVAHGLSVYFRHSSGRFYCIQGDRLVVYDFQRGIWRDIMAKPFDWEIVPPSFGGVGCSTQIVVSPDQRHLAYTEPSVMKLLHNPNRTTLAWSDKATELPGADTFQSELQPGLRYLENAKLIVVNLETGQQIRMPTPFGSLFRSRSGFGGRGPRSGIATPLLWRDNTTILLGVGTPRRGVAEVDTETGEMWDIAGVPDEGYSGNFRLAEDGQVYLTLGSSTYRVDFEEGSLFEAPSIMGDFSIERSQGTRCIMHKDKPIDYSQNTAWMQVSPDGRKVAWTTHSQRWGQKAVYIFSAEENLAQKVSDSYVGGGFLWVADRDMVPVRPPRPPTGWQSIKSEPWTEDPRMPRPNIIPHIEVEEQPGVVEEQPSVVEEQSSVVEEQSTEEELPDINDVLEMTLSVVRDTFKLGDKLALTVKIRNKSGKDYAFDTHPELASALDVIVSNLSGVVGVDFGTSERPFPINPLELKAYKDVINTQTIEPSTAAEYTISAQLCFATEDWPGQIEANPVNITVLEPNEFDQQLKERFEHDIAEFHKQFQARREKRKYSGIDTDVQKWARELGPHMLEYLIAELETESSRTFQKRLSRALRGIVTPQMLVFLKRCLTEEMIADHEYILDCLMSLYNNDETQDEALEGLLLGLNHDNVRYRRNAVERMVGIKDDPRIAAALANSVHEDDKEVGETSARYLAASEGLNLADWFGLVATAPTYTRYGTARWIISDIKEQWNGTYGNLPELEQDDFSKDNKKLNEFLSIAKAWELWARKNPNYSDTFFTKTDD